MLIGIISDIHGNDIALKLCLEEMGRRGVTELLFLGDLVGYYYNPHIALSMLKEWKVVSIAGNHDRMLFASLDDHQLKSKIIKDYGHGIEHAKRKLSAADLEWLRNLPTSLTIERDNLRIHMCHGAPFSTDFYVYPDAKTETLKKCASGRFDFVLMGHTHHPLSVTLDGTHLVNPGSVGQPRDIGNLASYAILNTSNRVVLFRRRVFPTKQLKKQVTSFDPQHYYLYQKLNTV